MYKTIKTYVEKITTITHEFDHFIKSPRTIKIFFAAKFHQETKLKFLKWNDLKGWKQNMIFTYIWVSKCNQKYIEGLTIKGLYFLFNL